MGPSGLEAYRNDFVDGNVLMWHALPNGPEEQKRYISLVPVEKN